MNTKSLAEKYYIHSMVITCGLFFFYMLGINNSFLYTSILDYKNMVSDTFDGTVAPIEFVPNPLELSYEQRKKKFEEIDSRYFIKAPIYNPNIFGKDLETLTPGTSDYSQTITQRLIYTVPYIGTYNFDYKEFAGSHPGIDIVVPEGTPVRNISAGVVVDIGFQAGGFGNYILVKHNNVILPSGKKSTVYSLYAHLLKSVAQVGTKVKKSQLIGYVGQTGTATTPHLHFQIDVEDAPYTPYWPFSSVDMKMAGVGFFEGVNIGLGKENALKYTINPLKFVNDHYNNSVPLASGIQVENETVKEEEKEVVLPLPEETKKEPLAEITQPLPEKNTPVKEDIALKTDIVIESDSNIVKKEQVLSKEIELLSTINPEIVLGNNTDIEFFSERNNLLALDNDDLSESLEKVDDTISSDALNIDIPVIDPETNDEGIIAPSDMTGSTTVDIQTLTGTQEEVRIFQDIKNDYTYLKELQYFKEKNIISGFTDGTFRPKNNITRIESLKMILLSYNIVPVKNEASKFGDIDTNSWENTYVNAALKEKIVSLDNQKFSPLRNMSRAEVLKLVLNLGQVELDIDEEIEIADVSKDDWYYKYARYSLKHNLFEGDENTFSPNKPITREELISILYQISKK